MGKTLFKRGFKDAKKELERQEAEREKRKNGLWRLFLQPDEEAKVRFLTEEPVTFHEHNIKQGSKYKNVMCIGEDCAVCNGGGEQPQFKGAFLVWDYRSYKNKEGKKVNGTLRLYVAGTKIISQLDRLHTRYGLTGQDITITRLGSGTSTTYTFEREEKYKLSKKEIMAFLPENLQETFDGTMESLYTIVENALAIEAPSPSDNDYTEKRSDDYDDEYDGEDEDNLVDDEDDEEEAPKAATKRSSAKKLFNKRRK